MRVRRGGKFASHKLTASAWTSHAVKTAVRAVKTENWHLLSFLSRKQEPAVPASIWIETVTGKRFKILVPLNSSIDGVKAKIQQRKGCPPDEQHLMFAGKLLESGLTLAECGIRANNTLRLVTRPRPHAA